MKLLICGSKGQLGRALQACTQAHEVVAVDFDELDITDFDAVTRFVEEAQPELVVNCAAYTQVDDAESDLEGAYRVNALGPRNLAVATHAHGVPLLHVSTDYVFSGASDRPYHEYDVPAPLSVYGKTKLAGELAVASLNPRHYIVRTAWLYADAGANFPLTMMRLAERGEVRVVNDQRGSPTYAPHLAEGIATLMGTDAFGVWHLAGNGHTTWFDLTRTLYEMLGYDTRVLPVTTDEFPRPAPRPACSMMESVQTPAIVLPDWREGLQAFVDNQNG